MKRLDWQTPEQARWQEDYLRERQRRHRAIADGFAVWTVCARKRCRRTSACLGPDPMACVRRLIWDVLDETERTTLQLSLRLRAGGAEPEAAWRDAERRVAALRDEASERSDPPRGREGSRAIA